MAEQTDTILDADLDEDVNPNYKPPAPKPLEEIVKLDPGDESLKKYKETLLGSAAPGCVIDEKNPNKVIVQKLSLLVENRDEVFIDLTKPKEEIQKESFTLQEGCKYQIKIYFYVQRDIVVGLKYEQKVHRKGVPVSSMKQMMGSYGPKPDLQSFITQQEEAPTGMLMRGDYKIKSKFTDDDQNKYVSWEWNLSVKKDW